MREIKFRAWVLEDEEYSSFMENTISGWYDPFKEYEEGKIILMQYTGLKDSKGKEIFEGDIVKYIERNISDAFGRRGEPWIKRIEEVKWSEITHSWIVPKGFVREVEVIGNIYENPELLEESHEND